MKDLSSRKQYLIAENELSRAQLVEDFASLRSEVHALTQRANSYRAAASSAALLVTGLTAFQKGRHKESESKSSWLKTLLKGAGLASTMWLAYQSTTRGR